MKIRDRVKELRRVRANELLPSPRNWRTHPKAQREALQGLLAEVGYADALLARELPTGELQLIDGHLRAETTPDAKVPVLVLDVTEEEADKLLVSLDPLAAMAGADPAKLDELLKSVSTNSEAVAKMLGDLAVESGLEPAAAQVVEDVPPEPLKKAVSKPGDLWILGEHRLLCGDSTKPKDVRHVMNGQRGVLFATDPPYLVNYDGTNHPNSKKDWRPKRNKDWSGSYGTTPTSWDDPDANPELYDRFIAAALAEAISEDAAWYCWHASRRQAMLESVWAKHGAFVHQTVLWVKNRPVLTRSWYMWRHEPCFFGWLRGQKPRKTSDEVLPNVWEASTVGSATDAEHPTSKPVELFAIPMRQHTAVGDVCYEPFSGSGSQLIAAEQLKRRCRAVEIEPLYIDVAVRRWQALTGRDAVLEGTRETWNARARAAKVVVKENT